MDQQGSGLAAPPPGLVIRPACAADAGVLAGLVSQLGYPTTADEMQCRLDHILGRADFLTRVGAIDGRVAAMAGVQIRPSYMRAGPEAYLMALVVGAAARGQGIGGALLAAVERELAGLGIRRLTLTSANHRAAAHRFYLARGYQSTGLRFARDLAAGDPEPSPT